MTITSIIQLITSIINSTIPIAAGVALLAFFWGVFQAFGKIDAVDKRAEARQTIFWSLIALFVIVTLSGIIAVVSSTFNLGVDSGGGGGTSSSVTPSSGGSTAGVPGTSGATNPLPAGGGGDPLHLLPTGRSTGPGDFAP
jgi:uncharacterized membrane protein